MSRHDVYRDGHVHVQAELCSTCIFRPGNLMGLRSGRVRGMVDDARRDGSTIICHQTLDSGNAACRGFFDRYATPALRLAELADRIRWTG